MRIIEGNLEAADLKLAFVVSKFNEFICNRLLEGALDSFADHNGQKENIELQ